MDGGACWAKVHGVAKSRTRLIDWHTVYNTVEFIFQDGVTLGDPCIYYVYQRKCLCMTLGYTLPRSCSTAYSISKPREFLIFCLSFSLHIIHIYLLFIWSITDCYNLKSLQWFIIYWGTWHFSRTQVKTLENHKLHYTYTTSVNFITLKT